jgi:hypothetical protein
MVEKLGKNIRNKPEKAWTKEEAKEIIKDWRRSKLSIAQFCLVKKISLKRLYRWRTKLEKVKKPEGILKRQRSQKPLFNFVEAKITKGKKEEAALAIGLGNGKVIEILRPELLDAKWVIELANGMMG